jgi:hypothetical protein
MIAEFNLGQRRRRVRGEVVKENEKTVWVRLPDGHIVSRHKKRHNILIIGKPDRERQK